VGKLQVKPGTRLKSAVDTTEVIVVRAPKDDIDLRCGGQAMTPMGQSQGAPAGSVDPTHASGTLLGKRYAAEDAGLELLCTKGGEGSLSVGEDPILQKDAKPLPSSD
jgi:hypothetical protein